MAHDLGYLKLHRPSTLKILILDRHEDVLWVLLREKGVEGVNDVTTY